jgi:hypothetical protein
MAKRKRTQQWAISHNTENQSLNNTTTKNRRRSDRETTQWPKEKGHNNGRYHTTQKTKACKTQPPKTGGVLIAHQR